MQDHCKWVGLLQIPAHVARATAGFVHSPVWFTNANRLPELRLIFSRFYCTATTVQRHATYATQQKKKRNSLHSRTHLQSVLARTRSRLYLFVALFCVLGPCCRRRRRRCRRQSLHMDRAIQSAQNKTYGTRTPHMHACVRVRWVRDSIRNERCNPSSPGNLKKLLPHLFTTRTNI